MKILTQCSVINQNQPALEKDRYKIRQAFIAEPGNSLIVADYGQVSDSSIYIFFFHEKQSDRIMSLAFVVNLSDHWNLLCSWNSGFLHI